jgi:hypothetical protein
MIQETLEKVHLHLKRAKSAMNEIKGWNGIDAGVFDDFEKIKTIDTFIYRFIKLQDMMGEKLFRIFLDEIGEYKDSMSLLDILDKLEKLEIIENGEDWMTYRKLRNKLTHEYPSNENEIVEGIKLSIEVFGEIEKILGNIESYKERRKLL